MLNNIYIVVHKPNINYQHGQATMVANPNHSDKDWPQTFFPDKDPEKVRAYRIDGILAEKIWYTEFLYSSQGPDFQLFISPGTDEKVVEQAKKEAKERDAIAIRCFHITAWINLAKEGKL